MEMEGSDDWESPMSRAKSAVKGLAGECTASPLKWAKHLVYRVNACEDEHLASFVSCVPSLLVFQFTPALCATSRLLRL